MSDRYFVETPINAGSVRLEGAEAHHLAHVMRGKAGDWVTLFDGSGAEFHACIEAVSRSHVDLSIVERLDVNRELPRTLTLAVALPKGDRQRWLVEKATELGVARLVPLIAARGVAQPNAAALLRLGRAVVEACKQCGRNRLMEITEPQELCDLVSQPAENAQRWIAHRADTKSPAAEARSQVSDTSAIDSSGRDSPHTDSEVVYAVGPEGGFTDGEVRTALHAGWKPLDLGSRILRVETAAIAVAAWAALSCREGGH